MSVGSSYAIGQAVFIKTDTPDFEEMIIPFKNLEEMVEVCSNPRPNLVLEKLIVYAMTGQEPVAVTLGFVAASRGQRPPVSSEVVDSAHSRS